MHKGVLLYDASNMISVAELDRIAQARLDDAKALLAATRYDGAIYLCGYAVEVVLKARICRTLNWPEFPATRSEFQAYKSFQTHELDVHLRLSGQEPNVKQHHFAHWNVVAEWKSESRYNVVGTAQQGGADGMIRAAEEVLTELVNNFARLESRIAESKGDSHSSRSFSARMFRTAGI